MVKIITYLVNHGHGRRPTDRSDKRRALAVTESRRIIHLPLVPWYLPTYLGKVESSDIRQSRQSRQSNHRDTVRDRQHRPLCTHSLCTHSPSITTKRLTYPLRSPSLAYLTLPTPSSTSNASGGRQAGKVVRQAKQANKRSERWPSDRTELDWADSSGGRCLFIECSLLQKGKSPCLLVPRASWV